MNVRNTVFYTLSAFVLINACKAQELPIILSSRWFHPRDKNDSLSTMAMVKTFGVTRIDWMYCENKNQLQQLTAAGIPYSLAINPQTPDSAGYTTIKTRIVDVNGTPVVAPWMKNWKAKNPYWGCVNNPLFKEVFYTQTKKLIDLGAYGIFVDDARFNDHAIEWGGCFCDYCMAGFNKYLKTVNQSSSQDFDYRLAVQKPNTNKDSSLKNYKQLFAAFQKKSVVVFLQDWKTQMSAYSSKPITFLTNNPNGNWDSDIYKVFDGGISEISDNSSSLDKITKIISTARNLGKREVLSYASDDLLKACKFVLHTYLNGGQVLIPWDTYLAAAPKNNTGNRFYKNTDSYAELFNFLKLHPGLFNAEAFKQKADGGIKIVVSEGGISEIRKDSTGTYIFLYSQSLPPNKAIADIRLPENSSLVPVVLLNALNPIKTQKAVGQHWQVQFNCSIFKVIQ